MSEYGQGRIGIGHQTAGKVRLTSLTCVPALEPRIRFHLAWAISHLQPHGAPEPPKEYRLTAVSGEVSLAENGPVVGLLHQLGPTNFPRSLIYVDEQQQDLVLDLDWFKFERLEEHRQGGVLELWLQLWPRAETPNELLEARVDGFRVRIPRDDWVAVINTLTGQRTDILEIQYSLTYAGTFGPSMQELHSARAAIDRGDYTGAVVTCRKAILLIETALKSTGVTPKDRLADFVDKKHVDIYHGIASRLKGMGNIQVHEPGAPQYSRTEALFAVRSVQLYAELIGALLAKGPQGPVA